MRELLAERNRCDRDVTARAGIELRDRQRMPVCGDELNVKAPAEIGAIDFKIEVLAANIAGYAPGVIGDLLVPGSGHAAVFARDVGSRVDLVIRARAGDLLGDLSTRCAVIYPAGDAFLRTADGLHLSGAAPSALQAVEQ